VTWRKIFDVDTEYIYIYRTMIFRVSRHCYDVIIYLIFLHYHLNYNDEIHLFSHPILNNKTRSPDLKIE